MEDELQMLDAWRAGDRVAGSRLFDRYFRSLLRFFASKGCDDVEDIVQRTFLRCVEARERLEVRSSFRAYLFAVARNELYDHLKREQRQAAPLNSAVHSLVDLGVSVSAVVAVRDEERWVLEGMAKLPLDDQLALELYYWESMSAAEIGAALKLTEGGVRSRIRRAKERLREALDTPGAVEEGLRALGATLAPPLE